MPRALAKVGNQIVAQTDSWETVEGNIYFPPSAITDQRLLEHSELSTFCSWKGYASYWNVTVDSKTLENAAWYYKEPYEKAKNIKDYIAFYKDKVKLWRSSS
ncbi:hypothetical protein BDV12DRAFT_199610 [Aspergillus spectabilis]